MTGSSRANVFCNYTGHTIFTDDDSTSMPIPDTQSLTAIDPLYNITVEGVAHLFTFILRKQEGQLKYQNVS